MHPPTITPTKKDYPQYGLLGERHIWPPLGAGTVVYGVTVYVGAIDLSEFGINGFLSEPTSLEIDDGFVSVRIRSSGCGEGKYSQIAGNLETTSQLVPVKAYIHTLWGERGSMYSTVQRF